MFLVLVTIVAWGAAGQSAMPLHSAFSGGDLESAEKLPRHGLAAVPKDKEGRSPRTPLPPPGEQRLASLLHPERMAALRAGTRPAVGADGGARPPLLRAPSPFHFEGGRRLAWTELHRAAQTGNLDRTKELLEGGAAVSDRDDSVSGRGRTALHLAAQYGHEEVAALLLERGAAVNETDVCCQRTALHYAAEAGREKVVALLLERGAAVDERNGDGCTALHLAAHYGFKESENTTVRVKESTRA